METGGNMFGLGKSLPIAYFLFFCFFLQSMREEVLARKSEI
jgi:hypothetical protein